jgi:hypothetical protein
MSKPCNREACALRLERLSASAKILAEDLRKHTWYDDARRAAHTIREDAEYVHNAIDMDRAWEAGDR